MSRYFKATRPDGTDFRTGTIDYGAALLSGEVVRHPNPAKSIAKDSDASASGYLSVATVPTDCTGMTWPCRLFAVEAVGKVAKDDLYPNKRRVIALRAVEELPAYAVFGQQGEHVVALLARAGQVSTSEAFDLDAAGAAAGAAAWAAARVAAGATARAAARAAAWAAAGAAARATAGDAARATAWAAPGDAALGLLVRDLISTEHYDTLTRRWRTVIGPIHPDDGELS